MIFCENPYYNEPGYELQPNDAKNTAYSTNTRVATIQYAIHPWVSSIPATTSGPMHATPISSTWRTVAQTHLKLFAAEMDAAISIAARKIPGNAQLELQAKSLHCELEKQGYLA